MSTTRLQFARGFLAGVQAPATPDAVQVVIAWQMEEGQTAGENDPLASINEHDAHGSGGAANRFSFASIDNGLAQSVSQCSPGHVYSSIGDAFRAGKRAPDLIAAIQRAGWCGGPHAPCPAYGAGIQSNYNRLSDPATYAKESAVLVGTTSITGLPTTGATGPSPPISTTGAAGATSVGFSIPNPLNLLPGVGGAVDAAGALGSLALHLIDPNWWKRVGVFVLGGVLAAWGLYLLGKDFAPGATSHVSGAIKGATKAAGDVAAVAAVA